MFCNPSKKEKKRTICSVELRKNPMQHKAMKATIEGE